jgi:hypothetical protein
VILPTSNSWNPASSATVWLGYPPSSWITENVYNPLLSRSLLTICLQLSAPHLSISQSPCARSHFRKAKKGKTETKKKGNPRPSCKDVLAPESVTIIHRIASNGAVVYHTKPLSRLIRSGPCAVPTQPFRTFDLQVARLDVVCAGDQHG